VKKNRLNRLKFKNNRPVWFGFISLKLKKSNRTLNRKKPGKKPSQTEKTKPKLKNRAKPV